ncbi:MAG: UDP-N-acetylmuramoyl-L-alanyl-D-glutamate--2,6-diaminopimelate ligase [Methylococcales bacterium]|nr:UDP-N-acetylmuramoyl-L-alanyl-D-glutamate--2,6-diaminopimelate ligase [Methylococcales bacterium]
MKLNDLLAGFVPLSNTGDVKTLQYNVSTITGLTLDSRAVVAGTVFIALAGSKQHGLSHASQAIANGACAILFDPAGDGVEYASRIITDIPMITVDNLSAVLGDIAARFYGHPSESMNVIGITGTNGKTSCSQFLSQVLDDCGSIGTLGWGEWGCLHKTLNTTPDALAVHSILAQLLAAKKHTVAMEVSSHGLEQCRVNGVHFKGAVFTNISRDHLDYHGSMQAYLDAKLALLKTPHLAFAVVNLDDAYSQQILAAIPPTVKVWGILPIYSPYHSWNTDEQLIAENVANKTDGIEFDVRWRADEQRVSIPLYGDFNVENVLCVLAVMLALGHSLVTATKKLAQLKPVAGRMERFGGNEHPLVFVDYAHTPDALNKVLSSVRKHCQQALWVVFGCGGNRDTGKRALMGACAEQWADHVIVTDDNPRFENSTDIVNAILAGCKDRDNVEVIQNREQAIHSAINRAAVGDCIVIAGKGHEDYQEINGTTIPFSDSACVLKALL